jgi:hypothetical protein
MRNRAFSVLAKFLGLFLFLCPAFSPAHAAEPGEFVTALAGKKPVEGKTYACFTRAYDPAWFSTHHFQRISAVRLLAVIDSAGDYGFQLRLGLNVRDQPDALSTGADCTPAQTPDKRDKPAICIGGNSRATLLVENKDFVRLSLSTFGQLPEKGAAFAEDDKHFRLARSPLSKCDDQAENAQERTLLDLDR